ncbi:MAG: hypothetical protein EBT22_14375, partial [Chloroflexi bacterium]|nr:hypothetical protein [Chloroflexota bacterium]
NPPPGIGIPPVIDRTAVIFMSPPTPLGCAGSYPPAHTHCDRPLLHHRARQACDHYPHLHHLFRPQGDLRMTTPIAIPAIRPGQGQRPGAETDPRLDWWRDARFGLFIHWGLYAIPAGRWHGEFVPGIGEWIMHRKRIPVARHHRKAPRRLLPVGLARLRLHRHQGVAVQARHHPRTLRCVRASWPPLWLLLQPDAGLASPRRRRQRLGLRRRHTRLRWLRRELRRPASARVDDRLRPNLPDLVRHAEAHDRGAKQAPHRPRARVAAKLPRQRARREQHGRLRRGRRQRHPQ